MNSIFHRTSIRKYTEKKVEKEKISEILKAAMAAPSAGNQQPCEFYIVHNREKLRQLATTSPYAGCVAEASVAFVICYRKNCIFPEYTQIDASAATENMLLQIDALGLGGVWLGIAPLQERMDAVREVIHLPENLEAFAIISCGYPAEEKRQQNRFDEKRIHNGDEC